METHQVNNIKTKAGTVLPLLNLKGKSYLPVAQRLVWFREEKPLWGIETSYLKFEDDFSIARAEIKDEEGRIIATATKREDARHFGDHMEKAETGAIGRALAAVGYGTQFAPELDEGERIVDTPQPAKPSKPQPNNLGSFVMPIGKKKGKALDDIDLQTLHNWLAYMKNVLKQDSDPSPSTKEAVSNVEAYLISIEKNQG